MEGIILEKEFLVVVDVGESHQFYRLDLDVVVVGKLLLGWHQHYVVVVTVVVELVRPLKDVIARGAVAILDRL